mmetsp:Transcript_111763/g.279952  ORF Transcript_111763/g.279952 Transcript_111763/m.279952 type:complete len:203 (-) Transcript_111763:304-912(-)
MSSSRCPSRLQVKTVIAAAPPETLAWIGKVLLWPQGRTSSREPCQRCCLRRRAASLHRALHASRVGSLKTTGAHAKACLLPRNSACSLSMRACKMCAPVARAFSSAMMHSQCVPSMSMPRRRRASRDASSPLSRRALVTIGTQSVLGAGGYRSVAQQTVCTMNADFAVATARMQSSDALAHAEPLNHTAVVRWDNAPGKLCL